MSISNTKRHIWDAILSYVTFAYNTAVQETTRVTPYKLVYRGSQATTLDDILPVVADEGVDITSYLQCTKEARQLTRLCIRKQQKVDSRHYNI